MKCSVVVVTTIDRLIERSSSGLAARALAELATKQKPVQSEESSERERQLRVEALQITELV
jgi:hypothetical protein